MASSASRIALGALLVGTGVGHFLAPAFVESMVPQWLPGHPSLWNVVSGVGEIATGAWLISGIATRWAGRAAAGLFAVVLIANVDIAVQGEGYDVGDGLAASNLFAWLRLPLQLPLIYWSLRVAGDGEKWASRSDASGHDKEAA